MQRIILIQEWYSMTFLKRKIFLGFMACVGSFSISYTIIPGKTPCLHCLLEHVPVGGMTCDTVGIISPVVQMVVAYQVSEALKILVEDEESLRQTLVSFDLWKNQYTAVKVGKISILTSNL